MSLIGERFGRLVIIEDTRKRKNGNKVLKCICDCGKIVEVRSDSLKGGSTKSCGCLVKEKAKENAKLLKKKNRNTLSYKSYHMMKARCLNEKYNQYIDYGGRGITICERWLGEYGFDNFFEDMGERPEGMTLDRINNDGNYEPSNCRWATYKEQSQNKRNRKPYKIKDDLTNKKFGRLTVIKSVGRKWGFILWRCKCECGNYKDVDSGSLRIGNTKSCGCLLIENAIKIGKLNRKN